MRSSRAELKQGRVSRQHPEFVAAKFASCHKLMRSPGSQAGGTDCGLPLTSHFLRFEHGHTSPLDSDLAEAVEIPDERDVGMIVSQHILDRRQELGRFTNLQRVADVQQFGTVPPSSTWVASCRCPRALGEWAGHTVPPSSASLQKSDHNKADHLRDNRRE